MPTIKRAQFNPSTLKASYNPVTKKAQIVNFCTIGDDSICFGAGTTPKNILVTFAEVRKCSDSSLHTNLNKSFWLTQDPGDPDIWSGTYIIDGESLVIEYTSRYSPTLSKMVAGFSGGPYYFAIIQGPGSCGMSFVNGGPCNGAYIGYAGTATLQNPCV